jgi:hypothetical protein
VSAQCTTVASLTATHTSTHTLLNHTFIWCLLALLQAEELAQFPTFEEICEFTGEEYNSDEVSDLSSDGELSDSDDDYESEPPITTSKTVSTSYSDPVKLYTHTQLRAPLLRQANALVIMVYY